METTLHRQLKTLYSQSPEQLEQKLGPYRIDVVDGKQLIEIQHSSLSSIRDKVEDLVEEFPLKVVKPLIVKKRIVRLSRKGGSVVSRRWSPKKGEILDIFDELIYLRRVFPNPNLVIDIPTVSIEEWRYKGNGRRRRKRADNYQLQDQLLLEVHQTRTISEPADLLQLLAPINKQRFDTAELARTQEIPRWRAQKIAYTLAHCGVIRKVDKKGNSFVYQVIRKVAQAAQRAA